MDGRWSSDRPDMPQRLRGLAGRMASRTRSPRAVMVVVALVAVVLVSAMAVSLTRTQSPGQAATAGEPSPPVAAPPTADESVGPVVTSPPSPSGSPSKSPSKSAKPGSGGEAPKDPPAGDDGDDDGGGETEKKPETKQTKPPATSVPSRPEAFGAWWASEGKYTAKWERPADDGGLAVTGYVVKKCSGQTVANVGSGTFRVDIYHDSISCLTVQAINAKGAGQTAYFDGIK